MYSGKKPVLQLTTTYSEQLIIHPFVMCIYSERYVRDELWTHERLVEVDKCFKACSRDLDQPMAMSMRTLNNTINMMSYSVRQWRKLEGLYTSVYTKIATCGLAEETEKKQKRREKKVTKSLYFTTTWRRYFATDLHEIW